MTLPCNQVQYPGLHKNELGEWVYKVRNEIRHIFRGKIVENLVQNLARNIVAEQMLIISKKYKVVLLVHDEICVVVRDDEAEEALQWCVKVMSTSPDWWPDIPLAAEGVVGRTFS